MAPAPLKLADVVDFLIKTLTAWARRRQWGQITITVQAGQIEVVEEKRTFRGALPAGRTDGQEPTPIDRGPDRSM